MTNITLDGLPAKTGTISDAGIIHYREGGVDKKMTVADFLTRISEEYSTDINSFLGAADKAAARAALAIARRTTVNNAAYTILATDKVVAQIGTMSAARTFTLPAAADYPAGEELIIIDQSGTVTNTNKITVSRALTDTIDGKTSIDINNEFGFLKLISDGTSKWKVSSSLYLPAFRATNQTPQNLSNSVATKIQSFTVDYDIGNYWNNSRYTPPSGKYRFSLIVSAVCLQNFAIDWKLYKNGSPTPYGSYVGGVLGTSTIKLPASGVITLNDTDYLEVYVTMTYSSAATLTLNEVFFEIEKIR